MSQKLKITQKNHQLYSLVMSNEGVCFTYNMYSPKDMFKDDVDISYHLRQLPSTHHELQRVNGSGYLNGLIDMIKDADTSIDYFCNVMDHGYTILLHSPDEFPSTRLQNFFIPLDTNANIAVEPIVYSISDDAKALSLSLRQCFLPNEKYLKYFKVYNQNNCEIECLANKTIEQCKCTAFFLPNEEEYEVCTFGGMNCAKEVWKESLNDSLCNCLPNCESVQYNAELHYHHLDVENMEKVFNTMSNNVQGEQEFLKSNFLQVFFRNSKVVPLKRISTYGWSDFIANCGGLMGLFMGVSILSIVEILYFCIVSIFCKIFCKDNQEKEVN